MVKRETITLDAGSESLGRLACQIAILLRGKNKATFAPNKDEGSFVKVTNICSLVLTGSKTSQKIYHTHSGYPGGLKEHSYLSWYKKEPGRVLRHAVERMLPKNRLRKAMLNRLIIE